ncbi:MAG: hypothetical protein LBF80_00755 [Spirochaetaceae bacterium]|jgi:hypothetical protein|nr:hypothetical protein [Spirochaetaceae bacterium]
MKEVVRYSEAFKRRNGIRGATTLHEWIKKYGREDILPKRKTRPAARLGGSFCMEIYNMRCLLLRIKHRGEERWKL